MNNEDDWRPFSTAPENCEDIMFCRTPPYAPRGNIVIASWDIERGCFVSQGYEGSMSGVIDGNVWHLWKPLPKLPE